MDHERVGFTLLPTHQDGTTISAFAFDRRIRHFEHWRRRGHPFNEGCRNDLERDAAQVPVPALVYGGPFLGLEVEAGPRSWS